MVQSNIPYENWPGHDWSRAPPSCGHSPSYMPIVWAIPSHMRDLNPQLRGWGSPKIGTRDHEALTWKWMAPLPPVTMWISLRIYTLTSSPKPLVAQIQTVFWAGDPPTVHKLERSLPRISRVTLSQLRSGHWARLRDFQCGIGKTDDSLCPGCLLEPSVIYCGQRQHSTDSSGKQTRDHDKERGRRAVCDSRPPYPGRRANMRKLTTQTSRRKPRSLAFRRHR